MKKHLSIFKLNESIRVLLVCFLLILSMAYSASAQQAVTLQEAVNTALEKNLQIKNALLTESIDAENYKQAKNNRLPNLSAGPQASLNYGRNIDPSTNQFVNQSVFGFSGSLSSQVLLFQGGLLRNVILENKLLLDVDKSSTAKIKNDLILNVITTYLAILSNQDLLKAANQQVDLSKQTLDQVQKKFDVGNNTLADLSQGKATVSTAELNQTTAQNNLDISILTLKQYMEMDPKTDITVQLPDISKLTDVKTQYDAQQVYSSAVSINPDVHLAEVQKQAYFQNIAIAKSYYYPSLSLFGSVGSNYSDARTQFAGYVSTGLEAIGTVEGTSTRVVTPGFQALSKKYPFTSQLSDNFNQAIGVSLQIPI